MWVDGRTGSWEAVVVCVVYFAVFYVPLSIGFCIFLLVGNPFFLYRKNDDPMNSRPQSSVFMRLLILVSKKNLFAEPRSDRTRMGPALFYPF